MKLITIQHWLGDGYYLQTYTVNDEATHYWDDSYSVWVKLFDNQKLKVREVTE